MRWVLALAVVQNIPTTTTTTPPPSASPMHWGTQNKAHIFFSNEGGAYKLGARCRLFRSIRKSSLKVQAATEETHITSRTYIVSEGSESVQKKD
jgi:hypothetical protein